MAKEEKVEANSGTKNALELLSLKNNLASTPLSMREGCSEWVRYYTAFVLQSNAKICQDFPKRGSGKVRDPVTRRFYLAALRGDQEAIADFLARGVDGYEALFGALCYRDSTVFKQLIKAGIFFNHNNLAEMIALSAPWPATDKQEILAFLEEGGIFLDPLLKAACLGDKEQVLRWIGKKRQAYDSNGYGVAHYLAANNHTDLLLQLNKTLNLLEIGEGGLRPLQFAALNGCLEAVIFIMKVTKDQEMELGRYHSEVYAAFHRAAQRGQLSLVRSLFQAGWSDDKQVKSVLKEAAYFGHVPVVQWLLLMGAVNLMRKEEYMPVLFHARMSGNIDLIHMLIGAFAAQIHLNGYNGVRTALWKLEDLLLFSDQELEQLYCSYVNTRFNPLLAFILSNSDIPPAPPALIETVIAYLTVDNLIEAIALRHEMDGYTKTFPRPSWKITGGFWQIDPTLAEAKLSSRRTPSSVTVVSLTQEPESEEQLALAQVSHKLE